MLFLKLNVFFLWLLLLFVVLLMFLLFCAIVCLFVWLVCLSKVLASKNYLLTAAFTGTERLCEFESISYSSWMSCEVK